MAERELKRIEFIWPPISTVPVPPDAFDSNSDRGQVDTFSLNAQLSNHTITAVITTLYKKQTVGQRFKQIVATDRSDKEVPSSQTSVFTIDMSQSESLPFVPAFDSAAMEELAKAIREKHAFKDLGLNVTVNGQKITVIAPQMPERIKLKEFANMLNETVYNFWMDILSKNAHKKGDGRPSHVEQQVSRDTTASGTSQSRP